MNLHRQLVGQSAQALAWTAFWQEQGPDSRCLKGASAEVQRALRGQWERVAARICPQACVLDVGCGGAIVGRVMAEARDDVRIIGVDAAIVAPSLHPRVRIMSATPVESLPFADRNFDACVSQFGLEYSDVRRAGFELARVLKPGAAISLIVHHADSSIVRSRRAHRDALRVLTAPAIRRAFLRGDLAALGKLLDDLQRRHHSDNVVRFAASRLRQRIVGVTEQRQRCWHAFVDALAPDMTISATVEASCVSAEEMGGWLRLLGPAFDMDSPILVTATGELIAWSIEGSRKRHG